MSELKNDYMEGDPLYSRYLPIRNRLRKFDVSSVVFWCIDRLHYCYWNAPPKQRMYSAWELLLLLQWALAHCEIDSATGRKATSNECAFLLNQVKDLSNGKSKWLTPGNASGINKFMRILAFQQFWTHRDANSVSIARQVNLFTRIPSEYPTRSRFKELSGIELDDFLILTPFLYCLFCVEKKAVSFTTIGDFKRLRDSLTQEIIPKFLDYLSYDLDEAGKYALMQTKRTSTSLQHIQESPLKKRPFLRIGDKYFLYSPHLLGLTLEHCAYDIFKDADGGQFAEKFGATFEKYLELGLNTSKLNYLPESQLKGSYPNSKVVDFLIQGGDTIILVESKAIEMAAPLRVDPTTENLAERLSTTIIKAFRQIYEFADTLKKVKPLPFGMNHCACIHALIVTYKDLYLVDGRTAWDEFVGKVVLPELIEQGIDPSILPSENIHFLSVAAWDKYVALCSSDPSMAFKLLADAVKKNWWGDPLTPCHDTAVFSFEQHLDAYNPEDRMLPYLKEPFETLIEHMQGCFDEDG